GAARRRIAARGSPRGPPRSAAPPGTSPPGHRLRRDARAEPTRREPSRPPARDGAHLVVVVHVRPPRYPLGVALYRKYRPASFAEVVGQQHVTHTLSVPLYSHRIITASISSGP